MPNTLVHTGVQTLITRGSINGAEVKWIYLGFIIPDVPWIIQRITSFVIPGIDPYALRAYVIVQASLFSCLILAGAFALVAKHSWKVFSILGLNVLLHLLLDATQTKWANGVHFLAPFSWELTNWRLYWPENPITVVLTGLGLVVLLVYLKPGLTVAPDFRSLTFTRGAAVTGLSVVYIALPFLLIQGPLNADNHFLNTLSMESSRTGRYVELDRATYTGTSQGYSLKYYGGQAQIRVEPIALSPPVTVSVQGRFVNDSTLRVSEYHLHSSGLRDYASYFALGAIFIIWVVALSADVFFRSRKG